jgi:CrcB protein
VSRILLVGIGGFAGSVARFWLSGLAQARLGVGFPFGTLAVNVLGCFAIGALSELGEGRMPISPEVRALLAAGFLGGFTTFSAFGNDTVDLVRARDIPLAAANVAAQIALGLAAVWLGRAVARWMAR